MNSHLIWTSLTSLAHVGCRGVPCRSPAFRHAAQVICESIPHLTSFLACKSVVAWVCLRVCEREGGWRWDGEGQVARFYELGSQSEGARYFRFSFKRWYFSQVGCVSQLRVSHLTPCIRFDMRLTRFEPNASQMARARLSI